MKQFGSDLDRLKGGRIGDVVDDRNRRAAWSGIFVIGPVRLVERGQTDVAHAQGWNVVVAHVAPEDPAAGMGVPEVEAAGYLAAREVGMAVKNCYPFSNG